MDDRTFWLAIRQALLMFISAIEKRWGFKESKTSTH
jgi:hypothetical protein